MVATAPNGRKVPHRDHHDRVRAAVPVQRPLLGKAAKPHPDTAIARKGPCASRVSAKRVTYVPSSCIFCVNRFIRATAVPWRGFNAPRSGTGSIA